MMEGENQKTVGIVTTFNKWDSAYSLTSVVQDQLIANTKYGYKTVLFVQKIFNDDVSVPENIEIRKIMPAILLEPYKNNGVPPTFEIDVQRISEALIKHAADCDILIAHDLHFIDTYLPYCGTIHRLCKSREIKAKWLLWTHSAPSFGSNISNEHKLRYQKPEGARLIHLNNYDSLKLAESYNTWLSEVSVVHNSVDPRTFWKFHPLVKSLIDKYELLEADYFGIYPLSSTRMIDGKQVHKAVKVFAKLKARGHKVRYVICNAHANHEREKKTIKELQEMFSTWGLSSNEVIFTSLEGAGTYEAGVPREVVSQLFQLTNVFIFPTISENCSLILLEAMLSKNILILNNSFAPLREFGGDDAIYFDFGALGSTVTYENEEGYYEDIAKVIENQMSNNRPLKAQRRLLKEYNYDIVFKRFIEPLYYEPLQHDEIHGKSMADNHIGNK